MAGFYIKKVIAKSDKKATADVTFRPGLNVIQGRSEPVKPALLRSRWR